MLGKNCRSIFYKVILFSFLILSLTACSSKELEGQLPEISDLKAEIEESVDLSNMNLGDRDDLEKLYDIEPDDLEDFLLYIPGTNISANEIAILKVKDKDKDQIDNIKEKISLRIENQSTNFKDYLPEEYFLIEKHLLKTKGNYILFTISEDVETIENIFDSSFK